MKGANEDALKSGVIQHLGSQSEASDGGGSITSSITVPGQVMNIIIELARGST